MRYPVVLAGALVALAGTSLSGQELRYSGSFGYATGTYSLQEPVTSLSVLNGLTLTAPRWSLSVNLPVVIQNSGAVSYVGGTQIPTGPSRVDVGGVPGMGPMDPQETTTTGAYEAVVGDPVARGTFTPYQGFGTLRFVDVQAMAKAPVADPASGVGTGQWDVGAGLSAGLGLGQTFVFGDVAVWSPGDLPDLALNEYASVSVGVGRPLSEDWSAIASVSYSTPVIDGISPPASVGGGISYRIGEGGSLNAGASYGLTDATPDFSFYLGWSASP